MSVNTPRGSDAITSSAMRREPLLSAPQEQQQEHHKTLTMDAFSGRVPTLIGLTLAAAWLAFGIICFHELLDLTWAAAFYFAVTTSMTVGYGDIDGWNPMSRNTTTANDGTPYVPEEGAIMFTIFYILGGMVVVGTAMGMFVSKVLEGNSDTGCRAKYPLAISAALCALTLLIGASLSAEINDYDFLHGLYWAVVTASTTGYGSGGPQTDGARLFAALYMLVSVACMGNFVGELSARPLRAHRAKLEKRVMSQCDAPPASASFVRSVCTLCSPWRMRGHCMCAYAPPPLLLLQVRRQPGGARAGRAPLLRATQGARPAPAGRRWPRAGSLARRLYAAYARARGEADAGRSEDGAKSL